MPSTDVDLTEFVSYAQSGSNRFQAGLEASVSEHGQLTVAHDGTSEHNIAFGSLKKEDLNLQKLQEKSKGRYDVF